MLSLRLMDKRYGSTSIRDGFSTILPYCEFPSCFCCPTGCVEGSFCWRGEQILKKCCYTTILHKKHGESENLLRKWSCVVVRIERQLCAKCATRGDTKENVLMENANVFKFPRRFKICWRNVKKEAKTKSRQNL